MEIVNCGAGHQVPVNKVGVYLFLEHLWEDVIPDLVASGTSHSGTAVFTAT